MVYYTLDPQGEPVRLYSLDEDEVDDENGSLWGAKTEKWLQEMMRHKMAGTHIVRLDHLGESDVSTVFLFMDYSPWFLPKAKPTYWETMVFGGPFDLFQTRCGGKRADALTMHEATVEMVKSNLSVQN